MILDIRLSPTKKSTSLISGNFKILRVRVEFDYAGFAKLANMQWEKESFEQTKVVRVSYLVYVRFQGDLLDLSFKTFEDPIQHRMSCKRDVWLVSRVTYDLL